MDRQLISFQISYKKHTKFVALENDQQECKIFVI